MKDPAARTQWLAKIYGSVVLGLVAATKYKHAELSFDEFQQFLEAVHSVQKTLHVPDALPPLKS